MKQRDKFWNQRAESMGQIKLWLKPEVPANWADVYSNICLDTYTPELKQILLSNFGFTNLLLV